MAPSQPRTSRRLSSLLVLGTNEFLPQLYESTKHRARLGIENQPTHLSLRVGRMAAIDAAGRTPLLAGGERPARAMTWRRGAAAVAVASACVIASCGLVLFAVRARGSAPVALAEGGRASGARQQKLADLLTAPLEGVATRLGHVIRSSLATEDGVATYTNSEGGEQRMPTVDDYACFMKSDAFLELVNDCCKTIYVSPHASSRLPLELPLGPAENPAAKGLPFGTRFRYFVGKGNQFMFNGASQGTIDFINRYFGFDIKTVEVTSRFRKVVHAFKLGDSNPPKEFVEFLTDLPEVLPDYEGMLAVDVASLPPASTVLYNNFPHEPLGSPAVILKYCEGADHVGKLNGGLPMKIAPGDCDAVLREYNVICTCGEILVVGWTWPGATRNVWEHSLVALDAKALDACEPPAEEPARAADVAGAAGGRGAADVAGAAGGRGAARRAGAAGGVVPAAESPEDACATASEYDPAAQHWYYWTKDAGGADVKMVRHWCPSLYVPQERWYKYQRYIPRGNNNRPAPPINDFDFLNSYARDEYAASRKKMAAFANTPTFDDWTLGNALGALEKGKARFAAFDDDALGNQAPPPPPSSPVLTGHALSLLSY